MFTNTKFSNKKSCHVKEKLIKLPKFEEERSNDEWKYCIGDQEDYSRIIYCKGKGSKQAGKIMEEAKGH